MPDEDLADLYGVGTKRLIEQVKRNLERFPGDLMLQLDRDERLEGVSAYAAGDVALIVLRSSCGAFTSRPPR